MDPVIARRSIRKYTDEGVSEEALETLLKAAMAAPSAGNEQPWHFVVIRDHSVLERVPQLHPYADMVPHAALAVLVCGDETLDMHGGYWVQDCAAATENILIEAQQLGLGAVWLGVYPVEERVEALRRLLLIPAAIVPFALVPVGHPAEEKPPAERFDSSRVHYDCWKE